MESKNKKTIDITPQQYVEIVKTRREAIKRHLKVLGELDRYSDDDLMDLHLLASVVQKLCVMMPEKSYEYVESVGKIVAIADLKDLMRLYFNMACHDEKAASDDNVEKSVCGHGSTLVCVCQEIDSNPDLYEKCTSAILDILTVVKKQRIDLRNNLLKASSNYIRIDKALSHNKEKDPKSN